MWLTCQRLQILQQIHSEDAFCHFEKTTLQLELLAYSGINNNTRAWRTEQTSYPGNQDTTSTPQHIRTHTHINADGILFT